MRDAELRLPPAIDATMPIKRGTDSLSHDVFDAFAKEVLARAGRR
jgi:hypothetical protein